MRLLHVYMSFQDTAGAIHAFGQGVGAKGKTKVKDKQDSGARIQTKQMAEEVTKEPEKKLLIVSSSPHLTDDSNSKQVMYEVIIGMLPATVMAIYLFQHWAAIVLVSCLAGCLGTELVFNLVRKKPQTLGDGSAIITAMILGLSLPPTFPWWGAFLGSIVAIGVSKMLFGGLGSNIFNPAMVGRAFLMACFGMLMTTWTEPLGGQPNIKFKMGERQAGEVQFRDEVAAVTQPTPLARAKQAIKDAINPDLPEGMELPPSAINRDFSKIFFGTEDTGGSTGETSALLWLVGGVFLLVRRTITYHIPLAVLGSAAVIATGAWLITGDIQVLNPETGAWLIPSETFNPLTDKWRIYSDVYVHPLVHLSAGGLMMCAFFIATDLVTCPLSKLGRVIFGIGVGSLIMLIRLKGSLPEGVMYAVLLMNAMTPLIDRWTRPKPLGGHVRAN